MGWSPTMTARRTFTRIVLLLDGLIVVGSVFLLAWVTALGATGSGQDTTLAAVLIDVVLLVAVPLLCRALPVLPWLPLTGGLLIVTWQLLTAAQIDRVETGVVLGLVVLVVLRQLFTGLDTLHLVRGLRADQDQLLAQAFNDSLTGLANRASFDEQLRRAIRAERPIGLIFCDLDDFKAVNDRLGHSAGDDVLRAVATRLLDCVRPEDTTARLGGDEFAILMADADRAPDVIGRRIVGAVGRPFQLIHRGRQVRVRIGASVGVAVLDRIDPQASPESLLAEVDQAMYAAKRRGKNQLVTFRTGATTDRSQERYLPLFDPVVGHRSVGPEAASATGDSLFPPDLPSGVEPVGAGPVPRGGTGGPVTPAARYRGSGEASRLPPRPLVTESERKAEEAARLAAAAQRSMERTLAGFEALEKESERRHTELARAQRRAFRALEVEAEVRAGTRSEAEVIPLSRAVTLRAQKTVAGETPARSTTAEPAQPPAHTAGQVEHPQIENPQIDEPLATTDDDPAEAADDRTSDPDEARPTAHDGTAAPAAECHRDGEGEEPDEAPDEGRPGEQRSAEAAEADSGDRRGILPGLLIGPVPEETRERAEQLAALSGDHVDVLYRPVSELRTGRIRALAVSVRWRHPVHGVLDPDSLITAAERAGMRRPLEERLLDSVCRDLARLRTGSGQAGSEELTAHLRLACRYLAEKRLVTAVERALRRHALPGSALVLLITGDGPMPDLDAAAGVLDRLAALGVRIGLDGFGAGERDVELLTRLPVGLLALDPSLTHAAPGSRGSAVLAGTVAMTAGLELSLCADAVVEEEQAARLAQAGVDLAQGPLYGAPVPFAELAQFSEA